MEEGSTLPLGAHEREGVVLSLSIDYRNPYLLGGAVSSVSAQPASCISHEVGGTFLDLSESLA